MANRPRRPKSSAGSATADGSGTEGVETSPAFDEVAPSPETADATPSLSGSTDATSDMAEGDRVLSATLPSSTDDASVKEASRQDRTGSRLPPPEHQPPLPGDTGETADETTRTFAAEEGLAPSAAPRRDLGEFEDDETVLTAAEPAEPASVEPYRDPHDSADHAASGTPFGALLAAALLGGIIGAGLISYLLYAGIIAPGQETEAAQQYASAGDVEQVQGDLGGLRQIVEQLQSAQAAGGISGGGISAGDFAQLTDRVTAAERSLGELPGTNEETAGAAAGAAETATQATQTAEAARQAAEAATQSANAAAEQAGAAQTAANEIGGRVDEFSTRIGEFDTRLAAIEAANREAAVAFSAAGLKVAIDRGGPFMNELEAFAQKTGGGEAVEGLRDYAANGVPTQAQLVGAWPETEAAMLSAIRVPDPGTAVGDQVLSGLRSLVTVRPTEQADPQVEGPEAAVSRMRVALEGADLAAWRSEWEGLPDEAKQASTAFADDVEARLQAMQVVDQALESASGAATGSNEG